MTIFSDVQKIDPGRLVEMFVLDTSAIGGLVTRFHAGANELLAPVVWQGNTYERFPVDASGFELTGRGVLPQPKIRVANANGLISALCRDTDDLIGAKVTRKQTLLKYLDAVNFTGGVNPTADPDQGFDDSIWTVNRKAEENNEAVTFELAAAFDVQGKMLPGRQVVANVCQWLAIGGYRGPFCGYSGGPVADINDNPTGDPAQDKCAGRIPSCKMRFGPYAELPYGGFPGTGLVR